MIKFYPKSFFLFAALFFLNIYSFSQIVISQVYGGGGNSGTTFRNDFIELFNRGTSPVSIAGWSVQYASSGGTTWQKTELSGTLQPGQYYLIQQAAGAGGTTPLPTPDATGSIAMSATAGKVALLNNNTSIASGTVCPSGAAIVDIVGYGTGTTCSETAVTPTLSNTTAAHRKLNGCQESDNNFADFAVSAPNPRNTASPFNLCAGLSINDVSLSEGNSGTTAFTFTVSLTSPAESGGVSFNIATQDNTATSPSDYTAKSLTSQTIPEGESVYSFTVLVNGDLTPEPNETFFVNITNVVGAALADGQGIGTIINDDCDPTHTIAQIQGPGNISPVSGIVTVRGIVTGRRSNGFFLQTPDDETDADPNTSEGIFIFTASAPPAAAAIGNSICVTGTVTEFVPSTDPNSPSQTELVSPSIILLSTGNPLPTPVTLTVNDTDPTGSVYQLEKYESMRVHVNSLTVVAPTQGSKSETNATSTSNGFFYGVITGINRPFREPGISVIDPLPVGAPATVTRWDANPELIGVGSSALGGTALNVATGAVLTNVTGPLDFRSRTYTIDIDAGSPPIVSNNDLTYTAVPLQNANELTVATFNIERFYDDIDDPGGDVKLTTLAYNNRLNKVSLAIRNVLRSPDVIGVVEVEDLKTLTAIANKVNSDAVLAGDPNPNYVAYLEDGNDVGLIDVGYLIKSARVNVVSVIQYGKTATYINPNNGLPETLNDRPPLVLSGSFNKPGCSSPYPFMVIVNHLRSLNGNDDVVDGRVRAKRKAQAEFLASLIQSFQSEDPSVNIISVGDYNAFQFNDGYVDLIGTIKGTPAAAADVVLASADLVNPDLTDLVDTHSPAQRYSYSFAGSAQTLDHILVNQNAFNSVSRFSIARLDADFPEVYRNDPNRPERISDHDAPIAYFLFADLSPSCTITAIPSNSIFTGGIPTTIYLGYGPQSVTLQSSLTGGSPSGYSWSGSNLSCTDCQSPVFTPTTAGVYQFTVTITNNYGCTAICSITINVIDVRAGNKMDKVQICHNSNSIVVDGNSVAAHLTHGDRLGACTLITRTNKQQPGNQEVLIANELSAKVLPNPSTSDFTILISGLYTPEKINLRIIDAQGRLIEKKDNLNISQVIKLGENYHPGLYFAEITQGNEKRVIKLLKL